MMPHCPKDCAKKTFCHKGEPLPQDKSKCYVKEIVCIYCGLPRYYVEHRKTLRIPTPKDTEQYWKGKACTCP
jgi:hypothetical protein